jgi:hypothetical protein
VVTSNQAHCRSTVKLLFYWTTRINAANTISTVSMFLLDAYWHIEILLKIEKTNMMTKVLVVQII